MNRLIVVLVGAIALLASGCGGGVSEDSFRSELIDTGLTEDQANCIINGLSGAGIALEDVTDEALGDNDPPQEVIDITIECVMGSVGDYGDDAALDALWDQCEAGDGAACDDLWLSSPLGSNYEVFATTCGDTLGIEVPPSCEDRMG